MLFNSDSGRRFSIQTCLLIVANAKIIILLRHESHAQIHIITLKIIQKNIKIYLRTSLRTAALARPQVTSSYTLRTEHGTEWDRENVDENAV